MDTGTDRCRNGKGATQISNNGIEFLREEYADMMDKQQWTVLPARLVTKIKGLRLSPLGLVPQRGRRDRMISDYSYFGVNKATVSEAPVEAMQFGRALKRLLQRIHRANDRFGPVYMSKIDLSDGFYRLWVKPEDTICLAVLFPTREGEEPLIGVPLTNPMGWCSSPPNFSACTETVADLANSLLAEQGGLLRMRGRPHRLDEISESAGEAAEGEEHSLQAKLPSARTTTPAKAPVRYWDIYVDDFCGLVQGNKWTRRAVKRALLHSLDRVFRPLDKEDTPYRQEPASLKKLKKGDATWATSKIILGWLLNTEHKTISLPPHRVERLRSVLGSIEPRQKYAGVAEWHRLLDLALDRMPPQEALLFKSDLGAVQEEMRSSVTEGYARKKDAHWDCWVGFCLSHGLDPFLAKAGDPVPYLQVFGARYQDGRASPSGKRARAHTVSDALRSVGQKITRVGAPDPRFNRFGELDYRLTAQLRSYRKKEAPPSRVKPVPITIIIHTLQFAYRQRPTAERKAVANMMCIAFFFCLRPGEYTGTTTDDQAFTLDDVAFFIGARRLHSPTASDAEIKAATSIQLTFTTQKNGIKGDIIAHSRSGDPLCCPVTVVIRQFLQHRTEAATSSYDGTIKLASYYNHHGTNMGERKVLNKYIPADFDPSLIPRGKALSKKDGTVPVRMMLPFSVQCSTCNTFLYRGRKFNSKKEPMGGAEGRYLGIQRFRFYIKCTHCSRTISFLTDPKNADYEMESGGTRNYEVYKDKERTEEEMALEKEKDEKEDPMKALENRVLESQREMADLDNLEEIRAMNHKHLKLMSSSGDGGFDAKAVLKALDDRIQEEAIHETEELNEHGTTEEEERLIQSIRFGKNRGQQIADSTGGEMMYGGSERGNRPASTVLRLGTDDERREEEKRKKDMELILQRQKKVDHGSSNANKTTFIGASVKIKVKRKKVVAKADSMKKAKTTDSKATSSEPPAPTPTVKTNSLASLLGDYGSSSESD
ncbi:unnamed protein product [Pseudo-nitzschia multistriata]|uniref:Splicing factor YJU2 n=1 Tax=Pseudo-nitzschia multistriata TaxID=183589 RepID=A0A448YV53_9STRA|nr:unnamed protein product [Pseudo-nitzschia multistriata]